MDWKMLVVILASVFLVFIVIRTVTRNPYWLSKENLSKSIFTTGILTLLMIAIIAVCVLLLRK